MENNQTFNDIVSQLVEDSDTRVYTNLLDAEFTTDEAYRIAFHSSFELDDEPGVSEEQYEAQLAEAILDASAF